MARWRRSTAPRVNPFRVAGAWLEFPRVARASQPWAGGWNPVGMQIEAAFRANPEANAQRDAQAVRKPCSPLVRVLKAWKKLPAQLQSAVADIAEAFVAPNRGGLPSSADSSKE